MTGEAFADHFSARAADYAAFRPTYPSDFIAYLSSLAPAHDLAWDAGTGNGQAATMLAEYFAAVAATDASAEQLARARPHRGVTYRVSREGASGLPDASADLVTVAQALHWFDLSRFYPEVQRVLRPRGVIAVWCYSLARMDPLVLPIFDRWHDERVKPYWPPERVHTDNGYRDLAFPFEEFTAPAWTMTAQLTRPQLLGYVGTWSAVMNARQRDGIDLVPELAAALEPVWPAGDDRVMRIDWPIGLRVGRRRE